MSRATGKGLPHAISEDPISDFSHFRNTLIDAIAPFCIGTLGMPSTCARPSSSCDGDADVGIGREAFCDTRGFADHASLSDEAVAQMIGASLPRSWFARGGVRSIRAESGEAIGNTPHITHVRVRRDEDGSHFTVYPKDVSLSDLMRSLFRAIIRSSDWRAPFYEPRVGQELARLMHARISSHDHAPFSSVASLPFHDHDARARQYWTELLALAFSIDASDEQEWSEALAHSLSAHRIADAHRDALSGVRLDIATIRRMRMLIDPDFEPWNAARLRTDFLHRAVRASYAERAESCLAVLPDDVRSSFALGIDAILHGQTPSSSDLIRPPSSDVVASFPSDAGYGLMIADRIHRELADCARLDGEIHSPSAHLSLLSLHRSCQELAPILSRHSSDLRQRFSEAVAVRDPSSSTRHLL